MRATTFKYYKIEKLGIFIKINLIQLKAIGVGAPSENWNHYTMAC